MILTTGDFLTPGTLSGRKLFIAGHYVITQVAPGDTMFSHRDGFTTLNYSLTRGFLSNTIFYNPKGTTNEKD